MERQEAKILGGDTKSPRSKLQKTKQIQVSTAIQRAAMVPVASIRAIPALTQEGHASEVFMGELPDFYHRYLTGELQFPENFGKTWSKADEEILYDMIDYACTVRQIAVELKRHPVSIVNKLAKYLDDDSIQNRITQDFYDVPVRELVR